MPIDHVWQVDSNVVLSTPTVMKHLEKLAHHFKEQGLDTQATVNAVAQAAATATILAQSRLNAERTEKATTRGEFTIEDLVDTDRLDESDTFDETQEYIFMPLNPSGIKKFRRLFGVRPRKKTIPRLNGVVRTRGSLDSTLVCNLNTQSTLISPSLVPIRNPPRRDSFSEPPSLALPSVFDLPPIFQDIEETREKRSSLDSGTKPRKKKRAL